MPKHLEGITDDMAKVISLLVWTDKTKQEIADEVGVNRVTIYKWYKRQDFMDELQKERRNKFIVYGDVASKELMKLVKDDSDKRTQLSAIKLVLGENGFGMDKLQVENTTKQEIRISLVDDEKESEEN